METRTRSRRDRRPLRSRCRPIRPHVVPRRPFGRTGSGPPCVAAMPRRARPRRSRLRAGRRLGTGRAVIAPERRRPTVHRRRRRGRTQRSDRRPQDEPRAGSGGPPECPDTCPLDVRKMSAPGRPPCPEAHVMDMSRKLEVVACKAFPCVRGPSGRVRTPDRTCPAGVRGLSAALSVEAAARDRGTTDRHGRRRASVRSRRPAPCGATDRRSPSVVPPAPAARAAGLHPARPCIGRSSPRTRYAARGRTTLDSCTGACGDRGRTGG